MAAADYWKKVCAVRVRARKQELGRAVTNTAIAAAVEADSGKRTTRQLVEAWFAGRREPYVSQLLALCRKLEMDLADVIQAERTTTARRGIFRVSEGRNASAYVGKSQRVRTRG